MSEPASTPQDLLAELRAAELQLKQLEELGFSPDIAERYCDGVTPVEELVERMVQNLQVNGHETAGSSSELDDASTPRARKPKAPFHWAAKRMMGK